MRIDNVNLLQKVQEFGRVIKPSHYEQGLPPIIDLAYREPTPKGQTIDSRGNYMIGTDEASSI
jgi:hypothetical protein